MLKNDFGSDVKDFYISNDLGMCSLCGKIGSELHHINGRGREYYASILNSALLCRHCHNRTDIHSETTRTRLMSKTKELLDRYDYQYKDIDKRFKNNI
jgi:5-methylcytosine-specific restriction endonuclease McrA